MSKMVVTNVVLEVERWLDGKAEREGLTGKWLTNVTNCDAVDGSNNIAITADLYDMAALQAAMASPSSEDIAAEGRHGAIQPIVAYIER